MFRIFLTKQASCLVLWVCLFFGVLNTALFSLPQMLGAHYDFTRDYGITEWLINYQAGFVRRGLAGEAIFFLWRELCVNPICLVVALSVILYLIYACLVFSLSKGIVDRWLLPSTLLLGFPLYSQNLVRKDIALLLLASMIYWFLAKKMHSICFFAILNLLTCFGLLMHEMFLFICFAPVVNLVRLRRKMALSTSATGFHSFNGNLISSKILIITRSVLFLSPSITLFVYLGTLAAYGNARSASIVHQSWSSVWPSDLPFPLEPGGSIMWLARDGSSSVVQILKAHQVTYFLPSFAWLIIFAMLAYIMAANAVPLSIRYSLSSWIVLQFLCLAPLFLIAYDAGRWIFLAFSSAFIFALQDYRLRSELPLRNNNSDYLLGFLCYSSCAKTLVSSHALPVVALFVGFPVATWSPPEFVASIPLYQVWLFGKNLALFPSLGRLLYH